MELNKLTKEIIKRPTYLYSQGRISLEEMYQEIVKETLNNFGLFEKLYRTREFHSNILKDNNKNDISELLKEKLVVEKQLCKKIEFKADDSTIFENIEKVNNIPTTLEDIFVKKPTELSDVIDKLNEVIRRVNETSLKGE